jgi:hypothetical protein
MEAPNPSRHGEMESPIRFFHHARRCSACNTPLPRFRGRYVPRRRRRPRRGPLADTLKKQNFEAIRLEGLRSLSGSPHTYGRRAGQHSAIFVSRRGRRRRIPIRVCPWEKLLFFHAWKQISRNNSKERFLTPPSSRYHLHDGREQEERDQKMRMVPTPAGEALAWRDPELSPKLLGYDYVADVSDLVSLS